MNDLRIVFMGTPNFASNVLEGLIDNGYNIVGVVTQPDKEVGRKKVLTPSPVKEVALSRGLKVFTPFKIRKEYDDILALNPDLIITCAYGQIIPKEILDYPKYKCINTHGSLLPRGRGGAPIQHALIDGDEKTGITLMYMNEKMDEGDILYQKEIIIDDLDTNTTLFSKLSDLALNMLLEFLPEYFKGNFKATKQDNALATYTYNLTKEDEFISFDDDTKKVYNHIRGLLDNPGAYFVLDNVKYKLIKVHYELTNVSEPNTFVGLENNYLRINCKDGFIKVFIIKPEGKNEMDGKSFYNGKGKSLVGLKPETVYEKR
ncbi:MAG: methionyl-tRNA formyltransferase [Erysipelotrichaceae bacterium]|nr:methionyl-tRNA formyltransferase [Erysipelotrichaceae bacterium]